MPAALATIADLEALWRPLSDSEADQAQTLLDVASAQLRQRMRNVDLRIELFASDSAAPLSLDPILVVNTVVGAVRRFLNNPTGALSRTVATGPYSETTGYGERTGSEYIPRGALLITDDDMKPLQIDAGGFTPGSIHLNARWVPF